MRRTLRIAALALLAIVVVIIFYVVIAFVGLQAGLRDRDVGAQQDLNTQIERQIELAYGDLDRGQAALAEQRINWLRDNVPNHDELPHLQGTVNAMRGLKPTPTLISQPVGQVPVPPPETATPEPTPTQVERAGPATPLPEAVEARFRALSTLLEQNRWQDAVREIIAFQLDYPAYQRRTSDQLLFDAYIQAGIELTKGDNVSQGVSYIEQARKLGTLTEDAKGYLVYANLYLTAIAYRDIDWPLAIDNYRELCTYAPLFHDSCALLYDANLRYANQLALAGEYCPALQQYLQAQAVEWTNEVKNKIEEMKWQCDAATPTPLQNDDAPPSINGTPQGVWTPRPNPQGTWTPIPSSQQGPWTRVPTRSP